MRLVREVRGFFAKHSIGLGPGVVAVSGGADSIALLRALREAGGNTLVVAHLNHQLRGQESAEDEAFVRGLAEQLGLPSRMHSLDVAATAAGSNLEATARTLRYEFLARVAAETNACWIATGHTADDQAETVLHRIVRGTGLQGLRGIQAVRELGVASRPLLIRPLIRVNRTDVLDYLASLQQHYREDSSNADPRFTRNRLRHELLPLLKTFNTDVVSALSRLAEQATDAFDILAADAALLLARVELPRAGNRIVLDATQLETVHPCLTGELMRLLWQREGWPTTDMSAEHWMRLATIAKGRLPAADFPEGISAQRSGRIMKIARTP